MLRKSVLAIACLALVLVTFLWGQGGNATKQQGFFNCDVDIRPASKNEIQVYWVDLPPPPTTTPPTPQAIGMEFRLWAPESDVVRIDFPDGTPGLDLKKGWANSVKFVYTDGDPAVVTMTICNADSTVSCPGGSSMASQPVDFGGSYVEAGTLDTPEERRARNDELEYPRVFIYGWNKGLEFNFLLRNNYKEK